MRTVPLSASAKALFDANGRAVARLRPQRFNEAWRIKYTSIQTTSAITTGMKVYRDGESESNFIETSIFNGNNDSSDTVLDLAPGESLVYVWTGGTPGATGIVSVRGTVTVR